jgi:hypothetical protein
MPVSVIKAGPIVVDGVTIPTYFSSATASGGASGPCSQSTSTNSLVPTTNLITACSSIGGGSNITTNFSAINGAGQAGVGMTLSGDGGVNGQATAETTVYDGLDVTNVLYTNGYLEINPDIYGVINFACTAGITTIFGTAYCNQDVSSTFTVTINGNPKDRITISQDEPGSGGGDLTTIVNPPTTIPLIPIAFNDIQALELDWTVTAYMSLGVDCTSGLELNCLDTGQFDSSQSISVSLNDPITFQVLGPDSQPLTDAVITSYDGINYMATTPEPRGIGLIIGLVGMVTMFAVSKRRRVV